MNNINFKIFKKTNKRKNTNKIIVESLKEECLGLYRKLEEKTELYLLAKLRLEEYNNKIQELLEENEKLRKKTNNGKK